MSAQGLRFGGYQGPASVHTRAAHIMGRALTRGLGGSLEFDFEENVAASGALVRSLLTRTEAGSLDGCYFSSSYLAKQVPELAIFDQPFLAPERVRIHAMLDGETGRMLAERVEKRTGYVLLGFWDNGIRHISTRNAPLSTPKSCRGVRIRTLDNDLHLRVFRSLAFLPRHIDVRDLMRAISDGSVDAQENPFTNIHNFGWGEVHRHVTLTGHLLGMALVLFNKARFHAWPKEIQEALRAAVREATEAQRQFATEDDATCAGALQEAGVTLHPLTETQSAAFVEAAWPELSRIRTTCDPALLRKTDAALPPTLAEHVARLERGESLAAAI